MDNVIMYSPSDCTRDAAEDLVASCAAIHAATVRYHVGAEFGCEVPSSDVISFIAWLEGYGFQQR